MSMRIITKSVLFCGCLFFLASLFADGPLKCETDASLQSKIKKIVEEVKLLPKDQLKLPPEEMAVFLKNIQTLSAGMSQNEVKRLLGVPDEEYTVGRKSSHNPDTITSFHYEQLVTRKPNPYYCISIMFSNRQQKIFAVFKITNIPRFVERDDFIRLERNQVIEEIWKRQGTDGTGKRRILIGIDTGFRVYDSPDELRKDAQVMKSTTWDIDFKKTPSSIKHIRIRFDKNNTVFEEEECIYDIKRPSFFAW